MYEYLRFAYNIWKKMPLDLSIRATKKLLQFNLRTISLLSFNQHNIELLRLQTCNGFFGTGRNLVKFTKYQLFDIP